MRPIIICLVMISGTAAGFPAVALADSADNPVYLALGDSVAVGVGVDQREQLGYVPVLHRWLREADCRDGKPSACPQLELVNLAVSGAKSSDLIATQLQPALALIAARNGDTDPGNDVEFITVDIGGNDLFTPVVTNCGAGVTPACVSTIQTVFTTYAGNLAVILGSLRVAAGPDTKIAVMTYYNPLRACHLAPLEPLGNVVLEGGGPLAAGLTI